MILPFVLLNALCCDIASDSTSSSQKLEDKGVGQSKLGGKEKDDDTSTEESHSPERSDNI